jgi:alpha-L-rhamnosidase
MGFRYARVKVLNGNAKIKKIVSIPISSLHNRKLEFKSKNENINKLINNTAWSQKANFIEVPTDCPQRDERLGWTGDAQIFSSTACYFYNCEKFFTKYLRDLVSEQGIEGAIGHVSPDITRNGETNDPRFITKEEKEIGSWYQKGATGWGDAITIIPWTLYRHYGNIDVLKNCQKSMIKWCEYLWSISNSPIISNPKSSTLLESIKLRGFTFGDWVPPIGDDTNPNPHIGDDCYSTIYHFISNSLLSKISKILGDEKNYIFYKNKSDEIKKAFAEEFITASGRLAYSDQTSYAMCFVNDLIPDDKIHNAKEYFKQTILNQNFKLGTGFHGTANLLKGLKKAGLEEMIERVLLQEKLPGWMYQIKQGATSIWERWNAMAEDGSIHDPGMNSFNHYAFGSVCEFIFENIVGIKPDEENPGFKNIIIEPVIIPSLCPISFKHESINGFISVDIKINNNKVIYKIEIPEGSRGELTLKNYNTIKVNGIEMDDSDVKLNSGVNLITFSIP